MAATMKTRTPLAKASKAFVNALKTAPERQYRIAIRGGLHPSGLSKFVSGAQPVRRGDARIVAIGDLLGLPPESCFEDQPAAAKRPQRPS